MIVVQTARLVLRRLSLDDAAFVLTLVNEPSWLRFIGDRGVRSIEDARTYIANGPIASYERNGFGLYLVELKDGAIPLGMCGLVKRNFLDDVDIGFAFLPQHWSKGYAFEAAAAVIAHARDGLGLRRLVAITVPDNEASLKLLGRLGLKIERTFREPEKGEELLLLGADLTQPLPAIAPSPAAGGAAPAS